MAKTTEVIYKKDKPNDLADINYTKEIVETSDVLMTNQELIRMETAANNLIATGQTYIDIGKAQLKTVEDIKKELNK